MKLPSLKPKKSNNNDQVIACNRRGLPKKIGWGILITLFLLLSVLFALLRMYVDYPLTHKIYWYETESATPNSACVITLKPVSNEQALAVLKAIKMTATDTITAQGYNSLKDMNDAQFYCNGSEPKRVALLAYRSNVYRHMSFIAFINVVYSIIFAIACFIFTRKIINPRLKQMIRNFMLKRKART